MSIYAQQLDIENYIEGWTTDDPVALNRIIVRCERDIDTIIFPLQTNNPPSQVISLSNVAGGTYDITWNGVHPATITEPWNASATQVTNDLSSLIDIGVGNVTVVGQFPVLTVVWTPPWAQGSYPELVIPILQINGSNLVGDSPRVSSMLVPGRKVDPLTDLNANQQLYLANATAAQVEYRFSMGEAFFVRPQYQSVRGPDFSYQGKLPMIGPKVRRELTNTGLIRVNARAVAGYGSLGVGRGWPTY